MKHYAERPAYAEEMRQKYEGSPVNGHTFQWDGKSVQNGSVWCTRCTMWWPLTNWYQIKTQKHGCIGNAGLMDAWRRSSSVCYSAGERITRLLRMRLNSTNTAIAGAVRAATSTAIG